MYFSHFQLSQMCRLQMKRKHGSIKVGCYKRNKDNVDLNQALVWRSMIVYDWSITYDSFFKIQGQWWTPLDVEDDDGEL